MTYQPSELEVRVASRKRELVLEILEHKKSSSRAGAAVAIEMLSARLTELTHLIKGGGVGLAELDRGAKRRLDAWIAK
jgi:hypothetical protein